MSLQTALSGLLGAQTGLNTVSNDLANASTTGFKSQSALFSDLYPAGSSNVPGIGVATEAIASDFSQGAPVATGNPLDAAIEGSGFFITNQNGQQQYTRDGAFQLSTSGTLETLKGAPVLGYSQSANGTTSGTLGSITINTGAVAANPSTNIGLTLDLNSGETAIPAATTFDPTNTASYNNSTSSIVYDTLGNANSVQLYFQQQATPTAGAASTWNVYSQTSAQAAAQAAAVAAGTYVAGTDYNTVTALNFNSSGALTNVPPSATVNIAGVNGAATTPVTFNFTGTTLGAQSFAVGGTTNNGYAPGSFSSASLSSTGELQANYTNGQTVTVGTLGIANFINQAGLVPVSGNLYASSQTSGVPVVNTPGAGQAGTLSTGNIEQSNASTSALLVSLIQYQQAYQANASVIQTEQQDGTRLTQI